MGKENGAKPWRQRDDDRSLLGRGELETVIEEVVGCRLADELFSLETLQQVLFDEHGIPVQVPALRGHVNELIETGKVTIASNGGGNGGPRVYHSESIRLDPTLIEEDIAEIQKTLEAEFIFHLCQGKSSHSIRARSCWDSDE
ncbi:MAG: hypothetical protein AAB481_04025 [Patescibacteria group bacterium]